MVGVNLMLVSYAPPPPCPFPLYSSEQRNIGPQVYKVCQLSDEDPDTTVTSCFSKVQNAQFSLYLSGQHWLREITFVVALVSVTNFDCLRISESEERTHCAHVQSVLLGV
ncbi:hypothetical protein BaRGS_00033176 [Batillaria attramentaria]|uniref:Uncharacterized protein n=1 Tax=Batillaria attramentaria TaxID=370345 RepID=A0ABD0JKY3_9CAEN